MPDYYVFQGRPEGERTRYEQVEGTGEDGVWDAKTWQSARDAAKVVPPYWLEAAVYVHKEG